MASIRRLSIISSSTKVLDSELLTNVNVLSCHGFLVADGDYAEAVCCCRRVSYESGGTLESAGTAVPAVFIIIDSNE
jgi:hypothetical protein